MNDKEQIDSLRKKLVRYNHFYYVNSAPLISDSEYDVKMKELEKLEDAHPEYKTDDSPSVTVGSSVDESSKFKKVKHVVPMLSLSNTYSPEDVLAFIEKVSSEIPEPSRRSFVIEMKFDGLSASLTYEKGKLVQGLSRGDGEYGEDITENIYQIKSIPHTLSEPIDICVRGEILFPLDKFKVANAKRIAEGKEPFANTRNAASGTMKLKDPSKVSERNLMFMAYQIVNPTSVIRPDLLTGIYDHQESMRYLTKLGFRAASCKIFHFENREDGTAEVLLEYLKEQRDLRLYSDVNPKPGINYDVDGLVIKLNSFTEYERIGYTSKFPKWATAYKFPAKQVTTKLIGIQYQVGRTGRVTPVAILKPTLLCGSTISKASLHNRYEILRKGIKIGDTVFIEKAAEIIPQIVKPVVEVRTGDEQDIIFPTHCPECGEPLYKNVDDADTKCLNIHCPARVKRSIEFFASVNNMDIHGLGENIISRLHSLGYLNSVSDIYELHKHADTLSELDNLGMVHVSNLLKAIDASKKKPYVKVLCSIGIPGVGRHVSRLLTSKFKTIFEMYNKSVEDFTCVIGIGDTVANNIVEFFGNEDNRKLISELSMKHKLSFSVKEEDSVLTSDKLKGYTFCITGSFDNHNRNDISNMITTAGGTVSSAVSKNTTYLVAGENAGSKLKKAKDIGVEVIDLDMLKKMLSD